MRAACAGSIRSWAVTTFVALLFSANTINIGGDLAAMGEAAELVPGPGRQVFPLLVAVSSRILQVVLSLFTGPASRFRTVIPQLALTEAKALFGTTNIRAIQPGYHRHMAARHACTGRIGSLRHMRSAGGKPDCSTSRGGGWALHSCRARRSRRLRGRLFANRSKPGARLLVASSSPESNVGTV